MVFSGEIKRGEVVVIIGPSGSGKSTLLRSLNLLEVPSKGHIYFDGVDITDKKVDINKHRQKMGMVFQHFNLFPHKTILQNITLAPVKLLKKTKRSGRRSNETSGASRAGRKGKCLSVTAVRRTEAENCHCAFSGYEPDVIAFLMSLPLHLIRRWSERF